MISALLIALAAGPQIVAEPLDGDRHMLLLDTDARTTFDAAQANLSATARRLCAKRTFFLGAFQFAAAKTGDAQASFRQELHCTNAEQLSGRAAATSSGSSEVQLQAVLKATYGYLAAKDGNRLSDAYAMLSRRAKLATPAPDWIARAREFNARAGAVKARRVTDISWYSDPPDAPEPGLYVAADYTGAFDNVAFLCGYVVWRLDGDGRFRLVREEQNFLERRRGEEVALLDRATLRAQMGCKD